MITILMVPTELIFIEIATQRGNHRVSSDFSEE